jgi:HK97 family phage prohead protease
MSDLERFYAVAPIEMVDVRDATANDDNTWTMSGYAAVFGQKADVYSDKFVRATVEISPKAFGNVLASQQFDQPSGVVHFNRGHDMNTSVAATDVPSGQPGNLQLSVDKNGLRFLAKVSRDDPDGIALASKMRAGVVRQASFAFTTSGNEITYEETDEGPDEENRLITEIQHLYDVCAAPQGLFPQTISSLQRYATLLGQPDMGGHHRQPDLGGETSVSLETGGGADVAPPVTAWNLDLDALLARGDLLQPITVDLTGRNRDVRSGPDLDGE